MHWALASEVAEEHALEKDEELQPVRDAARVPAQL
jgi:hypothetical protein